MLPVTRQQFAALSGIVKNPNPYISRYIKMGDIIETHIDGKKFIDIDHKSNYNFITSRVAGSSKHMELIQQIAVDRECPKVSELKNILGVGESNPEPKKEVKKTKSVSKKSLPVKEKPVNNQISIDNMLLSSLKDYNDFYAAKQRQERWEMLKIEKAKMLGETIPTNIAIDSLSVFASSMQKIFVEMTKQWIVDISHEARLDAKLTGKMRGQMVDIVNNGFKKAMSVAKKQLKDGVNGSKLTKIEIKEDE